MSGSHIIETINKFNVKASVTKYLTDYLNFIFVTACIKCNRPCRRTSCKCCNLNFV